MKGPWLGSLATFKEYRAKGVPIGVAPDPAPATSAETLAIWPFRSWMPVSPCACPTRAPRIKPSNRSTRARRGWRRCWARRAEPAASVPRQSKRSGLVAQRSRGQGVDGSTSRPARSATPPCRRPQPTCAHCPRETRAWSSPGTPRRILKAASAASSCLRDGQELAQVPPKPVGKYGRPLFQSMTYHDTPSRPLPEMRYVDASAKPEDKHTYAVITVNSVELKSEPSAKATPQKEPPARRAEGLVPFEGEKSSWHGFDRYDFLMDEQTLEIKPAVKGKGARRGSGSAWWSFRKRRRQATRGPGGAATGTTSHRPKLSCSSAGSISRLSHPTPAARQSVGHVVRVPDGEAWASEEGRLRRDEQRRGE